MGDFLKKYTIGGTQLSLVRFERYSSYLLVSYEMVSVEIKHDEICYEIDYLIMCLLCYH